MCSANASPPDAASRRELAQTPPLLSSHLVLNALNRMAADDFARGHPEDPTLFALSAYLQDAFVIQNAGAAALDRELRLLQSFVNLHAQVTSSQIDLELQSEASAPSTIPAPGLLAQAAECLIQMVRPKQRAQIRLRVMIAASSQVEELPGITFQLEALGDASHIAVAEHPFNDLLAPRGVSLQLEHQVDATRRRVELQMRLQRR